MHPIERLRYVARAEGAGPSLLGVEAAQALAGFGGDPAGLLTACRRLLDRHTEVGPVWWMAARALMAPDPLGELYACGQELEEDGTAGILAAALPDDSTVLVVGWPEQAAAVLERRGDVEVLAVSAGGDGDQLARRLERLGADAIAVPDGGVGPAAAEASLVLLEATAVGPEHFVAPTGSLAAAAVAHHMGVPVWLVVGVGRVIHPRLWTALAGRLDDRADAWDDEVEIVPLDLVDAVFGTNGREPIDVVVTRGDCPCPPELLKTGVT